MKLQQILDQSTQALDRSRECRGATSRATDVLISVVWSACFEVCWRLEELSRGLNIYPLDVDDD